MHRIDRKPYARIVERDGKMFRELCVNVDDEPVVILRVRWPHTVRVNMQRIAAQLAEWAHGGDIHA